MGGTDLSGINWEDMKMTVIVFLCVSLSVGDNGYHGGVYRLSLISQTFCFRPFTHHVSGYGCMGGKRWTQQTKTQNPALMLIVHRNNKKRPKPLQGWNQEEQEQRSSGDSDNKHTGERSPGKTGREWNKGSWTQYRAHESRDYQNKIANNYTSR